MTGLFTGVSAFPLTPLRDDALDEDAYAALVRRVAASGVDSVTALGSTGSYAYLSRDERRTAVRVAVDAAADVPVFAGIGALRTRDVQTYAEDAQDAGASAVLLAPLAYQEHTPDDVFGLYADVARDLSVPLIVYDNPRTTHFSFTDELYGRIAELAQVASIKIPGIGGGPQAFAERLAAIRVHVPERIAIGVSGDATAAAGLSGGCDLWYSVIAGLVPACALTIARAALDGDADAAAAESDRLGPLWDLFARYGSVRVVAALAELWGLAAQSSLPLPMRGLDAAARADVAAVAEQLGLRTAS